MDFKNKIQKSISLEEQRCFIKFGVLQDHSPGFIHSNLVKFLGREALSAKSVQEWCAKLNAGETSCQSLIGDDRVDPQRRQEAVDKMFDQSKGHTDSCVDESNVRYKMVNDQQKAPQVPKNERPVFAMSPCQVLTLDSLMKYIEQSSYLYDSTNPLFASSQIRVARWHEIGAYFGVSGETIIRHWLKAVSHYKYVLRKLLAARLRNEPQMNAPGPWFDKVGSIIGVTFDQAMTEVDPSEGLDDCLNKILLPSRNLQLEREYSSTIEGSNNILP